MELSWPGRKNFTFDKQSRKAHIERHNFTSNMPSAAAPVNSYEDLSPVYGDGETSLLCCCSIADTPGTFGVFAVLTGFAALQRLTRPRSGMARSRPGSWTASAPSPRCTRARQVRRVAGALPSSAA